MQLKWKEMLKSGIAGKRGRKKREERRRIRNKGSVRWTEMERGRKKKGKEKQRRKRNRRGAQEQRMLGEVKVLSAPPPTPPRYPY